MTMSRTRPQKFVDVDYRARGFEQMLSCDQDLFDARVHEPVSPIRDALGAAP
jgi:hypothetical protein